MKIFSYENTNKILNVIKNKVKRVIAFFNKNKYFNIFNTRLMEIYIQFRTSTHKKQIYRSAIIWVIAFACIIGGCRIANLNAADASSTIDNEVQTEERLFLQGMVREIVELAKGEMETITGTKIQNNSSVQPIQIETIPAETETTQAQLETVSPPVDISTLDISATPLKDDVTNSNKKEITYEVDDSKISTKPSTNYDESQFEYGIDISAHQGLIDWAKVKAAGIDYAIIRVGNRGYETGKLCKDKNFDVNVRGAINNGIKVGVYFFSQAITTQEAREEAYLTLEYIRNYNISYPVVIDWETDKGYRTYNCLTKRNLTDILTTYCDIIKNNGYTPMVYMCMSDFGSRIYSSEITSKYKTWVAWYFKKYASSSYAVNWFRYGEALPDLSFDYNMWQYSCKCRIPGIPELVDMDINILPKVTYEVKLSVENKSITTNIGKSVDWLNNVIASDSSGNDARSKVKVTIYNKWGSVTSADTAINQSDQYTVRYEYTDVNGTYKCVDIPLYVRNYPTVFYQNTVWPDSEIKTIKYNYNNQKSVADNLGILKTTVIPRITSCYYDTVSGISNPYSISSGSFEGFDSLIKNINGIDEMRNGMYTVKYRVSDKYGLTSIRNINIIVENVSDNIEETTTDDNVQNTEIETETQN